MINTINLPPFKKMCMTVGNLPSSFMESMTYYEALEWLYQYIDKEIKTAINTNSEAVSELQNAFVLLKNYVDTYFDNLDVQEEINNKLDEMAESGELADIIAEFLQFQIDNTLVNYVNLREKDKLIISENDLYNSLPHTQPQGMCVISDSNIVLAYVNAEAEDQNVRLIEYNLVLKSIIRTSYLQLNHANSLTYDNTNGKIYVAFCNQTSGGVTSPDNRIGIVDYSSFTLENVVTPSNIPSGERIRSVSYDNENNILYAGSYFKVFKLNSAFAITDTINLNTENIDTTIEDYNLNQTFKIKDDKIYGLFMSFVGIWKDDGTLLKIIDLSSPTNLENIGEFEDFDFLSNSGVLISATKKESSLSTDRINMIYITSFTKNIDVNLPFTRLNNDTNTYDIYVNGSYSGQELGTSDHPYKSLQKAINIARNLKTTVNVNIAAGTYPSLYLNGVYNLNITLLGTVTIDGIRLFKSNFYLYNPTYNITINGMDIQNSNVVMRATSDTGSINILTNTDTDKFYTCANITYNSEVLFQKVNITGSDTHDLITASQSRIKLDECVFTNYENLHAVYASRNSIVTSYNCTFNETVSSTQHNYRLETGSILFKTASEQNINAIELASQSFDFPSLKWCGGVEGDGYTGTLLTTLDTHYNAIVLRCRTSGTSAKNNYFIIPIYQNNAYTVNAQWLNSLYVNNCMLCINRQDGGLVIEYNRLTQVTISNNTIHFYNYGDNGAPTDQTFMQVLDIGYINI